MFLFCRILTSNSQPHLSVIHTCLGNFTAQQRSINMCLCHFIMIIYYVLTLSSSGCISIFLMNDFPLDNGIVLPLQLQDVCTFCNLVCIRKKSRRILNIMYQLISFRFTILYNLYVSHVFERLGLIFFVSLFLLFISFDSFHSLLFTHISFLILLPNNFALYIFISSAFKNKFNVMNLNAVALIIGVKGSLTDTLLIFFLFYFQFIFCLCFTFTFFVYLFVFSRLLVYL